MKVQTENQLCSTDGFASDRRFLVWDFNQSHSQLLLRSPHNQSGEPFENIDIIFVGTFYMRIPSLFWGLVLEVASAEEGERVFQEIDWAPGSNHRKTGRKQILKIITEGRSYYIGAAGWRVNRNILGSRETSLEVNFK